MARRPYDNVYVSWLISTGQSARGQVVIWRDADGAVAGVCYYGAQIVPSADGAAAIDAFAERTRQAREAREARMLVGPRCDVERFWARASDWFRKPSITREAQPLYALDRTTLRAFQPDRAGDAARATPNEVDELVPHSARMIAGEIGGNPAGATPEFRSRCARIVAAGWWWRYRVGGRLAFTCNVGSASRQTAQVQGVWAPPEMRGAGHATRGFAAICADMLQTFPTLCLYVNDFNAPAIALYERVGFTRVGEFATMLFA